MVFYLFGPLIFNGLQPPAPSYTAVCVRQAHLSYFKVKSSLRLAIEKLCLTFSVISLNADLLQGEYYSSLAYQVFIIEICVVKIAKGSGPFVT